MPLFPFWRKWIFDQDNDAAYEAMPEAQRPGGFNWAGAAPQEQDAAAAAPQEQDDAAAPQEQDAADENRPADNDNNDN